MFPEEHKNSEKLPRLGNLGVTTSVGLSSQADTVLNAVPGA